MCVGGVGCVCVGVGEGGGGGRSVTIISNKTDKSVGNVNIQLVLRRELVPVSDFGLKSSHEGLTLDLGGAGVT